MDAMSILVVDDKREVRMLLTELLAADGLKVQVADSGEVAISSLSAQRPDLVLVDIRMPDMDGFEVCRRLKQSAETRDIPVIFLSGTDAVADRLTAFQLGAVDFISKPF